MNTMITLLDITNKMTEAALYEALAEECVELAHASLKIARIMRAESPTPLEAEKAKQNFIEEVADVRLTLDAVAVKDYNGEIHTEAAQAKKFRRWYERLATQAEKKSQF